MSIEPDAAKSNIKINKSEMSDEDLEYSYKSVLLAILPKFTAALSLICSSAIIAKVLMSPSARKLVKDRIMLGLSISDVLVSFIYFLGTWLVPRGTVGGFGPVYLASGTKGTCSYSGFFNQFGVALPIYNATLSWYYLLTINYNWKDYHIKKVEHWFHIIPFAFASLTSIIAVSLDLFGNVDWTCWINPDSKDTPVKRAFQWFQWFFLFGPIWVSIIFQSVVMYLLYRKMRHFEEKMKQYSVKSFRKSVYKKDNEQSKIANRSSVTSLGNSFKDGGISLDDKRDNLACVSWDSKIINNNLRETNINGQADLCDEENPPTKIDADMKRNPDEHDHIVFNVEDEQEKKVEIEKNNFPLISETLEKDSLPLLIPEKLSLVSATDQGRTKDEDVIELQPQEINPERTKKEFNSNRDSLQRIGKKVGSFFGKSKSNQNYKENAKSREIAIQGMLFVGAFYITWLFPTIQRITELAVHKNFYVFQILDTTLLPLQGFLNFIIYTRPQYKRHRKEHSDVGFWKSVWDVTFEIPK